MKNKKLPKKIKENFIFDYTNFFIGEDYCYCSVKNGNWCGELDINGKLHSKFVCKELCCSDTFDYITILDKTGVIDKRGNFIIPPKYDDIWMINENLWKISVNEKYGLIDTCCQTVWNLKYDSINTLCVEGAYLVSLNGKYGIIDINEKEIVPIKYDYLQVQFEYAKSNRFYATLNGKKGVINLKNEIIIPIEYEDIYYLTKNRIVLKIGLDRFIIINEQNKQICKTIFEVIDTKTYFSKNPTLYSAKLNGKWGFIDKNGNVVIDFKYTHTYNILGSDEKYIGVSIDKLNTNTLGLIDKDENQILPFEYEFPYLAYIDNDRFIVSKNGKCGIIDRNNNVIANFIFDDIFPICLAKSEVKQYYQARVDDKYGFIDRDGKPLHIDKESLNISETELNLEMLSMIEQIKYLFS